jgi:50S ribosomal protein L16 3-hydroxylase
LSLTTLLGTHATDKFFDGHFLKLPFALHEGAEPFCSLGNWDAVERILRGPNIDLIVASQRLGVRSDPQPRTLAEARLLCQEGFTLGFRHVQTIDDLYGNFAAEFLRELGAPVDIHLYCTPKAEPGFGWHYDAEEVFILQTIGSKEWSLRKNTVNPWPLLESIPDDMEYTKEIMPLMKCRLEVGDWLYIPSGYWHSTFATEDSISLSVGINCRSGIDIFDSIRDLLLKDLRWRQRLPIIGDASPLTKEEKLRAYRSRIAELKDDLIRRLTDDSLVEQILETHYG